MIASSHDLNHSLQQADCVWLMHQGKVVAQGAPAAVLTPPQLTPLYQITFRQLEIERAQVADVTALILATRRVFPLH